jgi:type IV pilus assembly protein PilC
MSTYLYEASNKENKITHGEYEANSPEEVIGYLTKRDLIPISVKSINDISRSKDILSIQLFASISSVDIMFFVRNLAITVKAGLSIVEAFEILVKDTKNKLMKKILEGVQAMVQNGQPLSVAFSAYKDSFPPIFIGMIKAGEVSGQLDKNLSDLAKYLSKEYALRGKIKGALTYPIILLVASAVVVALMLMFVLPKLTASFAASGVALPWITQVFLFISNILTWNYIADVVVVSGIIFFFSYFRNTKIGKRLFFFIASRLPVANDLIKKIALVRFTRTLGNLLGSGLSVVDSLSIASESVNNQDFTDAIDKAIEDIKSGIPISESLNKYPKLFPNLLMSLIVVGERTGSLQEILITFADFYDEEVDNTLKELTSVLEPALLLIMGLMIGAIAVSIILPIYQLIGHFV